MVNALGDSQKHKPTKAAQKHINRCIAHIDNSTDKNAIYSCCKLFFTIPALKATSEVAITEIDSSTL